MQIPERFLALARLFLLLLLSTNALAQGARMRSALERDEADQPQRRALWMKRDAPRGESAAGLRLRAYQQKMAMRTNRVAQWALAGTLPEDAGTAWVNLGPAPLASDATGTGFQDYGWVSGRATSVMIDPADATGNTVLLGGAYGGLWRSTNALTSNPSQVSWQSLIDDQPTLAVGAVAVQPGSGKNGISQVILVGTGETNSSGDSYYGLGILRSADGGNTWAQITSDATGRYSFLGIGFSKITFSSANPNLVVVAAAGDIGLDLGLEQDGNATARGLYWSNNAGQTWNRVILSDNAVAASAASVVYNAANATFYAAIRRHGIYSSTDGQHFTRLNTQPTSGLALANCPAGQNSSTCQIYRGEFAVVTGRNEMYTWIVDYQNGEIDDGIWRTTNGGTSWTHILDNGIAACGDPGGFGCGVQQGIYNLELAAVPDGSVTDLYAGAINLYKCTLTGGTTCSQGDWINLTHVYGCDPLSAPAHVHPDQHGLAFIVAGGKSPGYFAHDGGISRTLDGYAGLISGSCTGTNQFDDLSETLGSMAEFVAFSGHPSDADVLLGGTQDNGSPATSSATSSTTWQNALSGDGGYNAINPAIPNEWFASNPDDSSNGFQICKCELGTSCNDTSFTPVVDSATLGGDHGAFYTPFILDPQNTNALLVGTCRVWRVSTAGTAPLALSYDFETLGTGICTGDEVNLVAAIAAGGPTDTSGNSKVVYATTAGYGPLSGSPGGEVWFTNNAGVAPMWNVTGAINSGGFTIAAVAIDSSDTTGRMAFVGIRGFHYSQVWKTSDGGANWTDWTYHAGLPDAPVNALLVDSGKVYAGTDVGVFVSATINPAWTEVGPVAGPGVTGFLPNAPVTAMQMFSGQGVKKLRVSTYGRGIWEYNLVSTPDFTNTISNSPQSVFPSQNAAFSGTLKSVNGYNSSVNLSCTGGVPASCGVTPAQLTPTPSGAAYTLNASGAVGDYSFNAHAVGTDSAQTTHDAAIILHVVDFALTMPNPDTVTVQQGFSGTTQFQVTAAGSFSQTVTLSCTGLPSGAACSFSPSASVSPTAQNPVTVTLTVSAAGNTPTGTNTVTVLGVTNSPAATRTTAFQLVVQPAPDFTWTTSGSTTHTVLAGQTTQAYKFVATPTGGSTFVGTVTFGCSFAPTDPTLTNGNCTFNPPSIAAGQGTTNVVLTITTAGPNAGTGGTVPQSALVTLLRWVSLIPFAAVVLAASSRRRFSKLMVGLGLITCLVSVALLLACGGGGGTASGGNPPPPQGAISVSVSPDSANLALGGTQQFSATVSHATDTTVIWSLNGTSAAGSSISDSGLLTVASSGTTPANFYVVATSNEDKNFSGSAYVTVPAVSVAVSPASGTSLYANEPGNSWPVRATQQQFTATVSNSLGIRAVTWAVSGGNANGTVDANGVYGAPPAVPNPAKVNVTATSQADATKSGSGAVTILQPTAIGNFTVTVTATEGSKAHARDVAMVVE